MVCSKGIIQNSLKTWRTDQDLFHDFLYLIKIIPLFPLETTTSYDAKWIRVSGYNLAGDMCGSNIRGWISEDHCHQWNDDVIKWRYFPRYWPFVRAIHRTPVISSHQDQWRGALMFSLTNTWTSGWVNNHEAGDLRRHRTHYDVSVMDVRVTDWSHSTTGFAIIVVLMKVFVLTYLLFIILD